MSSLCYLITILLMYFSISRFVYQTQHLEFLEPFRRPKEPTEVQKITNRLTVAALNELDQLANVVSIINIMFSNYIT